MILGAFLTALTRGMNYNISVKYKSGGNELVKVGNTQRILR